MRNQQHEYRKKAAELGIWDDKLESEFVRIMEDKDTELEIERSRVSDKVWALEHQLMKERVK